MFIFIRLLLAHFIGDFPLQFNRVYALKLKGIKGGVPHALFVTLSLIVCSFPFLYLPGIWLVIAFVGLIHLLQDRLKTNFKSIKYAFWFYALDQIFHVATIAVVFLTDLKYLKPPRSTNFIISLYNNDLLILYLIAAIFVTYNGFFLIRNIKDSILGKAISTYHPYERWYGMFERLVLVTIFLLGGCYLFLIPAVLFMRPALAVMGKERLKLQRRFLTWLLSWMEILLSWTVGLGTGITLYIITRSFILTPPPCR